MKKLIFAWMAFTLFPPVVSIAQNGLEKNAALNVYAATLGETGAKTPEISTEELRRILEEKSATLFDVRPAMEFATSHIPGAVNVAQKAGTSKALYVSDVAEISRLLGNDKAKPVVLYCNGPFCGKSKRVSKDLLAAGFTNAKRYQLGIPVWRALGGVTQIEPDGAGYVVRNDKTAVWLDTRTAGDIAKAPLSGARRIGIEVAKGGKAGKERRDATHRLVDHDLGTRCVNYTTVHQVSVHKVKSHSPIIGSTYAPELKGISLRLSH